MDNEPMQVWVFNGEHSSFPSGVFTTRDAGEEWISKHKLNGVLTAYPLNTGVYEWAVARGTFSDKKEVTPELVGKFSSAYQEHHHYTDGHTEP